MEGSAIWIKLLTVYTLEVNGTARHLKPGDWADIGRGAALRLISEGIAVSPRPLSELLPAGVGAWVSSESMHQPYVAELGAADILYRMWDGKPRAPFPRCVFLRGSVPLRLALLPVGLTLLAKWELVAPLYSYDVLASKIGSEEDRDRTKSIIHDLRVPVYDTRLLFMRRSKNIECLMTYWHEEMQHGGDERLAFMRALYLSKPQILAVPTTWTDQHPPA